MGDYYNPEVRLNLFLIVIIVAIIVGGICMPKSEPPPPPKYHQDQRVKITEHNLICKIAQVSPNNTVYLNQPFKYDYMLFCGPVKFSQDHVVYVKENEIEPAGE